MLKKTRNLYAVAGLLAGLALMLAACGGGAAELGTEENPIIWAFVPSGELEEVTAGGDALAELVFEETGLVIETFVATEYAGVIEAMCSDPPKAHMASLATFSYLLANERGCAEAELVAVRFGSPTYNGQILTRADSGISEISQLDNTTWCRGDEFSTSGWIIPSITMAASGVDTSTVTPLDTGGHPATVIGVLNGDCDAGGTWVDARTAVEDDFPEVMDEVTVIDVSMDIPNDGVQYVPSFPREMRDQLNAALLKLSETEEGVEAMNIAYQWEGLVAETHEFYVPFAELLDSAGMAPEDFAE
jgi:phosphonate transport system substrate-binding protein